MSQTNGGKFRFNPNLYAVGGSLSPKQTAVTKLSHQGWQSVFVAPWHLVWARLDRGEVDAPSGMYSDSRDPHRRLTGMVCFLQVLISIQSMILCEEPYLNEPGWANNGGTPKSIACESFLYRFSRMSVQLAFPDSANVRRMVVRTAVRCACIHNLPLTDESPHRCSAT